MSYKYTHFIKQNTAPKGAKSIGVYNGTEKVAEIPLGRMTPPTSEPLYSFGLVSDIHLYPLAAVEWTPETKFRNALTYFQTYGCVMCIQCGDITQTGFYRERTTDGVTEYYFDDTQMQKYREIRGEYTMPVYGICGNHESYYSKNVTLHPDETEEVMGKRALSYTLSGAETTDRNEQVTTIGNDLFILCGQPSAGYVMSDDDFQWLTETLETNSDRRCFVFVHPYIEEDSGDPCDLRENSIFDMWGATRKAAFMELMQKYSNVILFHGHSHTKFESQEYDISANYTEKNGFKSVHVPSLGMPRELDLTAGTTPEDKKASQGYIVDVYDDCIVLNGWNFVGSKPIPLGTYRIDT